MTMNQAQNRDVVHAAGGDFMTRQLAKEGSAMAAENSKQEQLAKEATPRKGRSVLSMAEDYRLCQWLHARQPKRGETPVDVFKEAAELSIAILNADHIRTRLSELADTLPKAPEPSLTIYERIERLERLGAIIARQRIGGDPANVAELAFLADFEHNVKNGQ